MSVFVLAWELGGHFGHAVPLARLANDLHQRGHEVHLVWRDLSLATEVLGEHLSSPRLQLWQAPLWLAGGPAAPATYAELLYTAGYAEPERLRGLATAWRSLLCRLQPAVLVADHAPTALLAAHGLPVRRVPFGSGFTVPPACSPLPLLRDWEAVAQDRIVASEAQALAACNQVLAGWGEAPMPALCALFDAAETFLMGWPELDHAGAARDPIRQRHWGHLGTGVKGLVPAWPAPDRPRILAYLRSSHPAIDAVLATLRSGPWASLVCLPGCGPARAAQLDSPSLRVLPELLDQSSLLPEAALYLSHGNFSSCHAALAAGVPCVMLPEQVEQVWFARRLAATGAGVWLWPQEAATGLGRALGAVLGSPGFRRSAAALAQRHVHQGPAQVLEALCDRCEELAAEAPRGAAT